MVLYLQNEHLNTLTLSYSQGISLIYGTSEGRIDPNRLPSWVSVRPRQVQATPPAVYPGTGCYGRAADMARLFRTNYAPECANFILINKTFMPN